MKVEIRCPICSTTENIEISKNELEKIQRGLLAINIPKSVVCEHNFVAYIDSNFHVRNYCTTDFEILVPEDQSEIQTPDIPINKMDPLLLKINLPPSILSYILRGIFSKHKIIIISDKEFLIPHLTHFFKYIMENSFEMDLSIILEQDYINSSKNYEEALIFYGNKIITNESSDKILGDISIEEAIVEKFLSEKDLQTGLIILKNEIKKAHHISEILIDIIKDSETKKKKMNPEEAIRMLEEGHNIKISSEYLEFLYIIIENYFGIEVPKKIKKVFQLYLGISYF
ncbi:MAG: hypothetical protein BAJALOKI3v1_980011 [Promethearchaeota archaeon]|jgi:hypothetical protein|nr:MAG: hypothetical protein BAJALOKI3v1_980011 [Candidatus Lokiarchaeota archaeon]